MFIDCLSVMARSAGGNVDGHQVLPFRGKPGATVERFRGPGAVFYLALLADRAVKDLRPHGIRFNLADATAAGASHGDVPVHTVLIYHDFRSMKLPHWSCLL